MGDLPRILARPELPEVPLPRTNPKAYGADVVAALADVALEASKQQRTVDIDKAMADYDLGVDEIKTGLGQESDTKLWPGEFETQERRLKDGILKNLDNFEAKRTFESARMKSFSRHMIDVRHEALKEGNSQRIAYGERASTELAQQAATVADPATKRDLVERFHGIVTDLSTGVAPAITPATAEEWRQRFARTYTQQSVLAYDDVMKSNLDNLVNRAYREPSRVIDIERDGLRSIDAAGGDLIPAHKLNVDKATFTDAVYASSIRGKIDQDPEGTLNQLRAGNYDAKLKDATLRSLRKEAEVEIERRKRQDEALFRAYEKQVGKEVDDFKGAALSGFPWSGNLAALENRVKGTEHEKEFNQARAEASDLYLFNQMGPAEQENYLRLLSQGAKTGDQAKLYAKLEAAHRATNEGLANDAITFAIRRGVIPNSLGPFSLDNPQSLQARSAAANMVEARYRQPVSPLSDDESKQLVNQFANMPADQRAVAMKQLNDNFTPRQVQAVASQVAKNGAGEMAQAFGMSSQVPEAASRILQGVEIKKNNPDALPKNKAMLDSYIDQKMSAAYQASPEAYASAKEAVKSVYAWASWKTNDLTGALNSTRLDNAIATVTGGLIPFNGQLTLPPRYGVNEKQFREMIGKADYSNVQGTIGVKDILSYGKLISDGPGRYKVTIGGSPVFDKSGKPFQLELNR